MSHELSISRCCAISCFTQDSRFGHVDLLSTMIKNAEKFLVHFYPAWKSVAYSYTLIVNEWQKILRKYMFYSIVNRLLWQTRVQSASDVKYTRRIRAHQCFDLRFGSNMKKGNAIQLSSIKGGRLVGHTVFTTSSSLPWNGLRLLWLQHKSHMIKTHADQQFSPCDFSGYDLINRTDLPPRNHGLHLPSDWYVPGRNAERKHVTKNGRELPYSWRRRRRPT